MKVYERTPLLDAQGNLSPVARIQGTLKYGLNWANELEAQKVVMAQFARTLEKGFVVIRNFNLPKSDIIIPLILIGHGALFVILATPIKGEFEAKENEWNTVKNGIAAPASRNLIDQVSKYARVFQRYLSLNQINVSVPIEPILILTNPGANVESHRPVARVVRSDAIKQFASSINQANPILRAEQIVALADLIVEPQLKEENQDLAAQTELDAPEAQPPPNGQKKAAARPAAAKAKKPTLSRNQMILLAVFGVFECCVIAVGGYFLYTLL
ncbi:MAG: NERD domain-containing protein [Anaerolineales bacterium]|nr:NERD domain-containing protein [Anaerolineales bacterium]